MDAMEAVETDETDRPKDKIALVSTSVFSNPFAEMLEEEERARNEAKKPKKTEEGEQRGNWYSNPGGTVAGSGGGQIGKYLTKATKAGKTTQAAPTGVPKQKKKTKKIYGNFDGW